MTVTQLTDLTKKNQEFIHIATNQLIKNGKTDEEIKSLLEEILPNILENQKKGITARGLYGAPSDWAAQHTSKKEEASSDPTIYNENPWLMWLDSSLFILALLGVLNGVLNLFRTSGNQYGILSMLVIGFGVGAGMYMMYYFVYRHMGPNQTQRPKFLKALAFLGFATLIWSAIFFLAAFIPEALNPILPPLGTITLGLVAFGIRYVLNKKYHIKNALQPVR